MDGRIALVGSALAAVWLLAACGERPDEAVREEPVPRPEAPEEPRWVLMPLALTADQEWGRKLYETLCVDCHGAAGRGDGRRVEAGAVPRPPDFTTAEYARLTGAELERAFREIVEPPDPIHPYMRLVEALVEPEAFVLALRYVPALVYPPEIPGSALAGREIYRARCVACHGYQGRGDGRAVREGMIVGEPTDLAADTLIARRDFDAVFHRVKEGTGPVHRSSMPAWGIIFSDEEIWDLVAFVATFQPEVLSPPGEEGTSCCPVEPPVSP
jgi:mono/diheme cytochrome c family protein